MKILIVDDDSKLRATLQRGLEEHGMVCETAADFDTAIATLGATSRFDLILLDVTMPGPSGWELLKLLRDRGDMTPVVFVTARRAVEDRVRGLELGADDYLVKPFAFQELLARIGAVERRRRELPVLEHADLSIDVARRVATRGERRLDLSPREFSVLLALLEAQGTTVSREELHRNVWGLNTNPGTNVVDVVIAGLRRKSGTPTLIETVVGIGYRLTESTP